MTNKVFENKEQLTDYLAFSLENDTELQEEDSDESYIMVHTDPGSNEIFIVDKLANKVYKVVIEEHGTYKV